MKEADCMVNIPDFFRAVQDADPSRINPYEAKLWGANLVAKDHAFREKARSTLQLQDFKGLPLIEQRMVQLKLTALYWLFVQNGITTLTNHSQGASETPAIEAATAYINRLERKVHEDLPHYNGVTVGSEAEFGGEFHQDHNHTPLDTTRLLATARKILNASKALPALQEDLRTVTDSEAKQKIAKQIDELVQYRDNPSYYLQEIASELDIPTEVLEAMARDINIPGLSAYAEITGNSIEMNPDYVEVRLNPSIDLRYQTRMLWYVCQNLKTPKINLHFTFGNVSINREIHEIMYPRLIAQFAGILPPLEEATPGVKEYIVERYPKARRLANESSSIYYPSFLPKTSQDLQPYPTESDLPKTAVESRGGTSFTITSKSDLRKTLRYVRFLTHAAYVQEALTNPHKTKEQKDYIAAWKQFRKDWNKIAHKGRVPMPGNRNGDFYLYIGNDSFIYPPERNLDLITKRRPKTTYESVLIDIDSQGRKRPDLRSATERLIIKFSAEMHAIQKKYGEQR